MSGQGEPLSAAQLDTIEAAYEAARAEMPTQITAAKRVHVAKSEYLKNWWIGYGKDESCDIEGTPNHWRWLAMIILGLADEEDSPYSEDRPTPEAVPRLIAEIRRLRELEVLVRHYHEGHGYIERSERWRPVREWLMKEEKGEEPVLCQSAKAIIVRRTKRPGLVIRDEEKEND